MNDGDTVAGEVLRQKIDGSMSEKAVQLLMMVLKHWNPVLGYEGVYEVSEFGEVRRIAKATGARPGRILTHFDQNGYPAVHLSLNNIARTGYIHILVAEAFLGPRPKGKEINHRNAYKWDCRVRNLEWVTHKENQEHAVENHLYKMGEESPQSKLTGDGVREIRRLRGHESQRKLAERFGVSQPLIGMIQRGEWWKHIKMETS